MLVIQGWFSLICFSILPGKGPSTDYVHKVKSAPPIAHRTERRPGWMSYIVQTQLRSNTDEVFLWRTSPLFRINVLSPDIYLSGRPQCRTLAATCQVRTWPGPIMKQAMRIYGPFQPFMKALSCLCWVIGIVSNHSCMDEIKATLSLLQWD